LTARSLAVPKTLARTLLSKTVTFRVPEGDGNLPTISVNGL
jgi:hypothetical protein